jgi:uroporphyrinogen decarboxylase
VPVQGNLDPAVLFAGQDAIDADVARIAAEGARCPGHVFNLGHGVLPQTDPDVVTRTVETIHAQPVG